MQKVKNCEEDQHDSIRQALYPLRDDVVVQPHRFVGGCVDMTCDEESHVVEEKGQ